MVAYLLVVCPIVFELICSLFIIKGLTAESLPIYHNIIFVAGLTLYLILLPDYLASTSYIVVCLFVKYVFRQTWRDSIVSTILCVLMVGIIELISFFPFGVLLYERLPDGVNNLLAAVCCVAISFFIYRKIPIYYLKKWCARKEIWYIATVVFSLGLMMVAIVHYHLTLELGFGEYICIVGSIILIWILVLRVMKYRYMEKTRKRYFDAFCSVIDQIRRRQHKFRNQMDAVYSLHKLYDDYDLLVQAQREYLGKLMAYEMPVDVINLENPILIAHVYEKITEAQEAGIRIRLKILCGLVNLGIQDIHMVEILGTLLDNAIQDMVITGEKEFLQFEVKEENGITVCVANPHSKMKVSELQKIFEKGTTTKGEGRGIGLYNVKKLVSEYGIKLMVDNRSYAGKNYLSFSVIFNKNY